MKGIIMSGNHPKLILDGIKTQTRRVVKMKPWFHDLLNKAGDDLSKSMIVKCPYGQVGDRLWVRETWADMEWWDGFEPKTVQDYKGIDHHIVYFQDRQSLWRPVEYTKDGYERSHWRPSIHMPRWASRITLEITEVRVERVQEISYEDCLAEGIIETRQFMQAPKAYSNFLNLWDSLNAKRGYGWEVNPWVWVISFRLDKEGKIG